MQPEIPTELREIAETFDVSDSLLLRRRALLRRVDTKFVAPVESLDSILHGLEPSYARVEVGGSSWANYETLYYDTPTERCFHDHRRGRLGRCKVRIRHYMDRGESFFEVKRKTNRRITIKHRRPKEFGSTNLEPDDVLIASGIPEAPAKHLQPRLWTLFSRLQLVGRDHLERITVDIGVRFRHGAREDVICLDSFAKRAFSSIELVSHATTALRPVAIIEVKQPHFRGRTPIMLSLRRSGIRRRRMSKYCTGVVLTGTNVRVHRFLPNLKQIARLQCSSS